MIVQHFQCVILVMMGCMIIVKSDFQKTWQSAVHVQSDGMRPVQPDDLALVFYLRVDNDSGQKISGVRLQMKHCCIHQHDGQKDCSSMRLLGDHLELLPNGQSAKLSMVFPTLYPMDLDGYCVVMVSYLEGGPLQHSFLFSTAQQSQGFINTMKESMLGVNGKCETADHDPQQSCQPVNCHLKYHGFRNYFNSASRLCEEPAPCMSTDEHGLPDKVFLMNENRCEQLEDKLQRSDLRHYITEDIPSTYEDYADKHLVRYVCDHGQVKTTGEVGCDCDSDWTTDLRGMKGLDRHMCNVRRSIAVQPILGASVVGSDKDIVMVSTLGIACGILSVLLIGLLVVWFHRHKKSVDLDSPAYAVLPTSHVPKVQDELTLTTDLSSWQGRCRKVHGGYSSREAEYLHETPTYTDADITETTERSSFIN